MVVINKPDLLIADEPTTALDVTTQAEILDLMLELQEEMGMADYSDLTRPTLGEKI